MSLYIGNLSPRVGKEELEHAFGRFGRCNIRLKDGYGFAIYGIRAQAEVALRALRGRNICGLPISLTWSNKQPNAPQSFNRGGRSYERQPGRGFGRRYDHMNGPLRSNARQHYKFRQPDDDTSRLKSNELPVEKESLEHVSEEREGNSSKKEDGQDRSDNADHNMLESGRWGEYGRLSPDSHIDDGTTFDRYEPDREYERSGQEGGNPVLHDISPGKEISEDKREEAVNVASGHQNIPRKNQACFKCGNLGHKMHDCPLQDRRLARSNDKRGRIVNSRHTDRIDSDGAEPSSRRRLSSTSAKERVRGRKDSGSGKYERVKRRRSSSVSEYNDRGNSRGRRKQKEDENKNFRHRRGKRSKRSLSRGSSASSFRSSSTSRSSVSYSSSRSMSDSKSNKLMSRSVKSRSRSPPTPLSLSVSLGHPLPSPPNKTEVKSNGYLDISTSLQTKPDVMQENQHLEVVADEDNIIGYGNPVIDVQSNMILLQENLQLEVVSKEDNNVPSVDTEVAVQEENLVACVDMENDFRTDQLQKTDDNTASLEDESRIRYTTRANYTSISMDELDRVMKHYNLNHTEEDGEHSSIEEYFGCARLWPWEIIYYRRLKKGSISTENYARRLAQNKEFGITDKYVRSSSGWGEPIQEL